MKLQEDEMYEGIKKLVMYVVMDRKEKYIGCKQYVIKGACNNIYIALTGNLMRNVK